MPMLVQARRDAAGQVCRCITRSGAGQREAERRVASRIGGRGGSRGGGWEGVSGGRKRRSEEVQEGGAAEAGARNRFSFVQGAVHVRGCSGSPAAMPCGGLGCDARGVMRARAHLGQRTARQRLAASRSKTTGASRSSAAHKVSSAEGGCSGGGGWPAQAAPRAILVPPPADQ